MRGSTFSIIIRTRTRHPNGTANRCCQMQQNLSNNRFHPPGQLECFGPKMNRSRFPSNLNLHWYAAHSSCRKITCRELRPCNSKDWPALAHSQTSLCHPSTFVVSTFIPKNRPKALLCQKKRLRPGRPDVVIFPLPGHGRFAAFKLSAKFFPRLSREVRLGLLSHAQVFL